MRRRIPLAKGRLSLTMPFAKTEKKPVLGAYVANLMKQHNAVEMKIVVDNPKNWSVTSPKKRKVSACKHLASSVVRRKMTSPQSIPTAAMKQILPDAEAKEQGHDVLGHHADVDASAGALPHERHQSSPLPTQDIFSTVRSP